MGAYIINIPDSVDRVIYTNVDPMNGKTYIASYSVDDLTPYTGPDLEQVKRDYDAWYEKGLADALDTVRKIYGMTWNEQKEVFGTDYFTDIIALPASECIEKIRQYEQEKKEKEEQIQVGDEVNAPFGKAIVVNVDSVAEKIWFLYADGHGGFDFFKNAPTKTGRHFPEIATVLKKMRGEQDG